MFYIGCWFMSDCSYFIENIFLVFYWTWGESFMNYSFVSWTLAEDHLSRSLTIRIYDGIIIKKIIVKKKHCLLKKSSIIVIEE